MISRNERLAMELRDSELWRADIPTTYTGKCPKCGKKVPNNDQVSFSVLTLAGEEDYEYHEKCVQNAFSNALAEKKKVFRKTKPVLLPFKDSKWQFKGSLTHNEKGLKTS